MSFATTIIAATEIINMATVATAAAVRALEAVQIGDEEGATKLLADARGAFSQAVSDWDAAGDQEN